MINHKLTQLQQIMSTELMISALRRGKNGSQIMEILNAITGESVEMNDNQTMNVNRGSYNEPTADMIEF